MPADTDKKLSAIFRNVSDLALLEVGLIALLCIVLIILVQRSLPWVARRLQGKRRLWLLTSVPFIRLLLIMAALALIVPKIIEPSFQNMFALLGTVGIAIGFALKDYASSLIAGIVAIGEQNYRNGDWVKINDTYGEVRHIGMRTVELMTPDDDRVLVPHLKIWDNPVHNATNGDARLQCVTHFYLHPEHDSHLVRRVLEDVALTSPYLYFKKPVIVVVKEEPWGSHYRLRAYPVAAAQQFQFISDLTERGKAELIRLGIRFSAAYQPPELPMQEQ